MPPPRNTVAPVASGPDKHATEKRVQVDFR